jgi:hypothetical protein
MVRSGRGPFKPARPRRARAIHEFFFENLRNPARGRRAVAMRQFPTGQVYNSTAIRFLNVNGVFNNMFYIWNGWETTRPKIAWSVDVQCDTCQLNIVSGPGKIALSKSGLHALRKFTWEAYKWIQYIYQVPYSSWYRYVRPSVLVLGTSLVRKIKKSWWYHIHTEAVDRLTSN